MEKQHPEQKDMPLPPGTVASKTKAHKDVLSFFKYLSLEKMKGSGSHPVKDTAPSSTANAKGILQHKHHTIKYLIVQHK